MYNRWFEDDPEKAVMPEIDNTGAGQVVLGVAVADLPYVAYMNGQYGFVISK